MLSFIPFHSQDEETWVYSFSREAFDICGTTTARTESRARDGEASG